MFIFLHDLAVFRLIAIFFILWGILITADLEKLIWQHELARHLAERTQGARMEHHAVIVADFVFVHNFVVDGDHFVFFSNLNY